MERYPAIMVGDPVIPVGDKYMVLTGQGDFRQTTELTLLLIAHANRMREMDGNAQA